MIAGLAMVAVGLVAAPAANALSPSICQSVVRGLLPRVRDTEVYKDGGYIEGVTTDQFGLPIYSSHDIIYTKMTSSWGNRYVIYTGKFRKASKRNGSNIYYKKTLGIMSYSYLLERQWRYTGYESDISRSGELSEDPSILSIKSISFFTTQGAKADAALRNPRSRFSLSGWGIGGSNISSWYICQGCTKNNNLDIIGQDLSTARASIVDSKIYLVTTRPKVVVALVTIDKTPSEYTICRKEVGNIINNMK